DRLSARAPVVSSPAGIGPEGAAAGRRPLDWVFVLGLFAAAGAVGGVLSLFASIDLAALLAATTFREWSWARLAHTLLGAADARVEAAAARREASSAQQSASTAQREAGQAHFAASAARGPQSAGPQPVAEDVWYQGPVGVVADQGDPHRAGATRRPRPIGP